MRRHAKASPIRSTLKLAVLAISLFAFPSQAAALSGDRGYEMVSPLSKGGVDIRPSYAQPKDRAAASGQAVAYSTIFSPIGGESAPQIPFHLGTRTSNAWTTQGISPLYDSVGGMFLQDGSRYEYFSEDLSTAIVKTHAQLDPANEADSDFNLYLRDSNGEFQLLTKPTTPQSPASPVYSPNVGALSVRAVTPDSKHIVFHDARQLTADSPPAGGPGSLGFPYVWGNGEIHPFGILPDGSFAGDAVFGAVQDDLGGIADFPGKNAISDDGSHLVFTTNEGGRHHVYVRIDNSSTLYVSKPDPGHEIADAQFEFATADGSSIFITSSNLIDASIPGTTTLYRYDVASETLHDLTTGDPGGAGLLGVADASDDASRIYFVATGDLASGASPGAPNLYLREDGVIRHIAVLDPGVPGPLETGDVGIWAVSLLRGDGAYGKTRMTDDGRYFAFRSMASVTDYDTNGRYQIYLYDAVEHELVCVSCNPRASASTQDTSFTIRDATRVLPRNLSADGKRVFFESREALVAGDSNGKSDVYEWEAGDIELVSGGESADASTFLDASASGDDVFFLTRQRLLPGDTDDLYDLYDARVGGGLPGPARPPVCEGDGCQSAPVAPDDATPASAVFSGPSSSSPRTTRTGSRCRSTQRVKRHSSRLSYAQRQSRACKRRAGKQKAGQQTRQKTTHKHG